VADAARSAREKKKTKKVITEDDLKPATPGTVTSATAEQPRMPGEAAPENANPPSSQPSGEAAPPENAEKSEESAKAAAAEQAKLKQELTEAQKELDLLQRELERDNYYSNPDYVHDPAGKAKLDALNQQIADKQQKVDELKARLAALPSSQTPPSPQS
jgi:predicted RNase H-like nuclease (RuvC/YqgF family)